MFFNGTKRVWEFLFSGIFVRWRDLNDLEVVGQIRFPPNNFQKLWPFWASILG